MANLCGLVDGLVGEGAGARDNSDAATLVDVSRHDADFALESEMSQITIQFQKKILLE